MEVPAREQHVGWFRFYFDDERWEWSPEVEAMHGYAPGTVTPTTELVLSHKHPDDYRHVAATLDAVRRHHQAFSTRHRIIDTAGRKDSFKGKRVGKTDTLTISHLSGAANLLELALNIPVLSVWPGSDGADYHFLSREDFQRRLAENQFLEWAAYNGNLYGTLSPGLAIDRIARRGANRRRRSDERRGGDERGDD